MRPAWVTLGALLALALPAAVPAAGTPELLVRSSAGALAECPEGLYETVEGFAPTSPAASKQVNSNGYTCYKLRLEPAFAFHGDLEVTLSDGFATARYKWHCEAAGLEVYPPPVNALGCVVAANSAPPLQAGPMTLAGAANGAVALGSWKGGVVFGTL